MSRRRRRANPHEPVTKVVFRVWPDRSVIALFPEERETRGLVLSYMHVGQHSAADYTGVVMATRPATRAEYQPLYNELTRIGYRLAVRQRK